MIARFRFYAFIWLSAFSLQLRPNIPVAVQPNHDIVTNAIVTDKSVAQLIDPAITEDMVIKAATDVLGKEAVKQIKSELQNSTLIDILCDGPQTTYELFKLIIAFKRESCITQTESHLTFQIDKLLKNQDANEYFWLPPLKELKPFLNQITNKEKEILQNNHYPLVHSAQENIVFNMDIYTQGWAIIKEKKPVKDFLFLRFPDQHKPPSKQIKSYIKHQLLKWYMNKVKQINWANPLEFKDMVISFEKEYLQELNDFEQDTFDSKFYNNYSEMPGKTGIRYTIADFLDSINSKLEPMCFKPLKSTTDRIIYFSALPWFVGLKITSGIFAYGEYIPRIIKFLYAKKSIFKPAYLNISHALLLYPVHSRLVFMGSSFLGSLSCWGMSPSFWFASNCNNGNYKYTGKKVMQRVGLEFYFEKYQSEFEQLEELHRKMAENKSVVVQFAYAPDALKKHVYIAQGFGVGYQNEINGIKTDDIGSILSAMRTNILSLKEKDKFEFCCIPINLMPDQGIKMYRHYYGDPTLVQEYYQKRDALFTKIRADYQHDQGIAVAA